MALDLMVASVLLASSDVVLTAIIGPLLVAAIGGGLAVYSSRPSKVANKAADIVQEALDLQKDTIASQARAIGVHNEKLAEAMRRIATLEKSEVECMQRVLALQDEVARILGREN